MTRSAAILGALLATVVAAGPVRAAPVTPDPLAVAQQRLDRMDRELRGVETRLQTVERDYSVNPNANDRDALLKRYSDAEVQFLVTDWRAASVLLYDLVSNPAFRPVPEYSNALYMLGEALFKQGNLLGARLYLREHLNLPNSRPEALTRYLEICGRLDDFSGVENYVDQARGPTGLLPVEVAYSYGKWLFHRNDIPEATRFARAREMFSAVVDSRKPLALQASYFLAVLSVQQGDLEGATRQFQAVLQMPAHDEAEQKVLEASHLALGRIYFEQGKYSEAIDRYLQIDYQSDNFIDALYEIAWAFVRRAAQNGPADYERAQQACEKLLMAAPDSVLAPEARILQGHLLLKLNKFQEASDAYTAIVNDYLKVHDAIASKLNTPGDPVRYFQQLANKSGKTFDLASLLPPIAVKWAATQPEVAEAVRVNADVEASQKGVEESEEVSARLLKLLERQELDIFPQHQDALSRADAVDAALSSAEGELLLVEQSLLGPQRVAVVDQQLRTLRQRRLELEERFRTLPQSDAQIQERRQNMVEQVNQVDTKAFQLGYQVEALYAMLAGLEHFVATTRDQRPQDPEEDKALMERMEKERAAADALRAELASLQRRMRDERARIGLHDGAEEKMRQEYEELLQQERMVLAQARQGLGYDAQSVLRGVDRVRSSIGLLRSRSGVVKSHIHETVRRQAQLLREQVEAETQLLRGYEREVASRSGEAHDLVGQVAYESIQRVRRQFYELVLKADVGLVDVAWTRKQEKTNQIQALAREKDREMKNMDDEFKEALKDVD